MSRTADRQHARLRPVRVRTVCATRFSLPSSTTGGAAGWAVTRSSPADGLRWYRASLYVLAVIRSWRNTASQKVRNGERPNRFRGLDFDCAIDPVSGAERRSDAARPESARPLKSVGLHKLKGTRRNQWVMTVNGTWRICASDA